MRMSSSVTAQADMPDNASARLRAVLAKEWVRPECFIAATSAGSLLLPGIFPGL
ncbi:hypothetical protein D3C78_1824060 [compost metagenome]